MATDNRTKREQLERYLEGLQKGEADLALQTDLQLPNAAFARLKEIALANEIERVKSTTTEQTYVEYCLAQRGCINDLNTLLDQYREAKNASAIVGAVKARSDIIDKMIKLGQDFGIIEKKPEEKRLVAGVVVTQLSNDDLRAAIAEQISSLNSLVTQYGDKNFAELDPGDLYRELPEPSNIIEAKLEPKDPELSPVKPEPEPELSDPEPEPEPETPPQPVAETTSERARRLMSQSAAESRGRRPSIQDVSRATGDTDKRNRAKSNKVHRGRRVVKPPVR
jgi:hypothetical protein